VSKEAADMILLDDNFATIVRAVSEGRTIYENIKKFILYILSCNLGEIVTLFFAPLLGLPMPLLPIHILWINLVTDGLPGIALVAEPAEKNIMNRPPRPPKESIFAGGLMPRIVITAIILASASIFIQWWTVQKGYDQRTQHSAVFSMLCFVQLANALSVRSMYQPLISKSLFSNTGMWVAIISTVILQMLIINVPILQTIFKTSFLPWDVISAGLLIILVSTVLIEMVKLFSKRKSLRMINKF
jgi:Ca2+-transporting ATPase